MVHLRVILTELGQDLKYVIEHQSPDLNLQIHPKILSKRLTAGISGGSALLSKDH